jgi:hypothetical protein
VGDGADATFQALNVDDPMALGTGNATKQTAAIKVAIAAETPSREVRSLLKNLPSICP